MLAMQPSLGPNKSFVRIVLIRRELGSYFNQILHKIRAIDLGQSSKHALVHPSHANAPAWTPLVGSALPDNRLGYQAREPY